jgi:hypothetical protein
LKRFVCLLTAAALVSLALFGCGKTENSSESPSEPSSAAAGELADSENTGEVGDRSETELGAGADAGSGGGDPSLVPADAPEPSADISPAGSGGAQTSADPTADPVAGGGTAATTPSAPPGETPPPENTPPITTPPENAPESPASGSVSPVADPGVGEAESAPAGPLSDGDFAVDAGGVALRPRADAGKAVAALGDGFDFSETISCDHEGMDKLYAYADLEIYTYPEGNTDCISEIILVSSQYKTARGVAVGDSLAAVTAAYGDAYEQVGVAVVYRSGSALSFYLSGDTVASISVSI